MNLTYSRLMMILVLFFMGFLRFSEVSNLKRSDFIIHNTHMSIFIEKFKTDLDRKWHWLHLAKLNSNLCPLDLTKRYFVLAEIDNQCDKYIFRGIENTKNGQKLRKTHKPLSYTTIRGHVLDRSKRYRNKTSSIKEPRSLAIAPTLKYTRLNYYEKLCFWLSPSEKE